MPVAIKSSGGGSVTIAAASTASDFTATLQSATGTIPVVTPGTSGNVLTSDGTVWTSASAPAPASLSTASGSAPSYSARAWVNFNGTGTVAIRASGNVSSITDNGIGNYTVNFTTAMPSADYAVSGNASKAAVNRTMLLAPIDPTSSSVGILTGQGNFTFIDSDNANVIVAI
jgi:hypothetical protein